MKFPESPFMMKHLICIYTIIIKTTNPGAYSPTFPKINNAFVKNPKLSTIGKGGNESDVFNTNQDSALALYSAFKPKPLLGPKPSFFFNTEEKSINNKFQLMKLPDTCNIEDINQHLQAQNIRNSDIRNTSPSQNENSFSNAFSTTIAQTYNSFIDTFSRIVSFCLTSPINTLSKWLDSKNDSALSPLWMAKFEIYGVTFRYIYIVIAVSTILLLMYALYKNSSLIRHRKTIILRSFKGLPLISSISSRLRDNRHLNALQRSFYSGKLKNLKKRQSEV